VTEKCFNTAADNFINAVGRGLAPAEKMFVRLCGGLRSARPTLLSKEHIGFSY